MNYIKSKNLILFSFFVFLIFSFFWFLTFFIENVFINSILKYFWLFSLLFLLISNLLIFCLIIYFNKKRKLKINKSFDSYVENQLSNFGIGLIIYNENYEIIWISNFIENLFNFEIIGQKLDIFSNFFMANFKQYKEKFEFQFEEMIFDTIINFKDRNIVLNDITKKKLILDCYEDEKPVISELEIDNFQQFQNTLSREDIFKIKTKIINMLDELSANYNFIYYEYSLGKYFLLFNNKTLIDFYKNEFQFFEKFKKDEILKKHDITISIGIGANSSIFKDLVKLSKEGLKQVLIRGGDQIAIMNFDKTPKYFGSKKENIILTSKVQIKKIAKLLKNKFQSPEIQNIIIYGHKNADLDSVGASLGLYFLAKKYKKNIFIQNFTFDMTTKKVLSNFINQNKKNYKDLFIKPSKAIKLTNKKNTLVILVDNSDIKRIENEKAFEGVDLENIFILDHHQILKLPDNLLLSNLYIDPKASSACEIITEIFQFQNNTIKPSKEIAQMLLNGICLDTKQFTHSTTTRTFEAAAWLKDCGADTSISSNILKLPEEQSILVSKLLSNIKEIKPGYFLTSTTKEVAEDIVSFVADEILRVQGRKAAFVVAKIPGKKNFKLSARGVKINVQPIAEFVGGGGNFSSAAAISKKNFSIFMQNILEAINIQFNKEKKNENNSN